MVLSIWFILATIILIAALYMLYTSYYCSNIAYVAGDNIRMIDPDDKTPGLQYVSSSEDSDSSSSSSDDDPEVSS